MINPCSNGALLQLSSSLKSTKSTTWRNLPLLKKTSSSSTARVWLTSWTSAMQKTRHYRHWHHKRRTCSSSSLLLTIMHRIILWRTQIWTKMRFVIMPCSLEDATTKRSTGCTRVWISTHQVNASTNAHPIWFWSSTTFTACRHQIGATH